MPLPEKLRRDKKKAVVLAPAQFLPQDRVVAFAQLKPGDLLKESERAMGDAHLCTLHNELIGERKSLLAFERVRPDQHRSRRLADSRAASTLAPRPDRQDVLAPADLSERVGTAHAAGACRRQ